MKPDVLEWGNLRGQSLGSSLCYRIRDAEDEMFLKNASKKIVKCSIKFRKNQLTSLRSCYARAHLRLANFDSNAVRI